MGLSRHTQLVQGVFQGTKLIKNSPIELDEHEYHSEGNDVEDEVDQWIKSINDGDTYALHRACSTFKNPLFEIIHGLVKQQGITDGR